MKMNRLCIIFLAQLLLVHEQHAAITEESLTDEQNQIQFRVSASKLQAINQHRAKNPTLEVTLHGTTIEKIDKKSPPTAWTLTLNQANSFIELSSVASKSVGTNVSRTDLLWKIGAVGANAGRELCVNYGHNEASWYNTYQSKEASWPMDTNRTFPKQQFNHVLDYPRAFGTDGYTGQDHTGILEHLFVNSDGFAILLDPNMPLFVQRSAVNGPQSGEICFSVANVDPYMSSNNDLTYLDIKLHLFSSNNIRTVLDYVVHESGLIPKPTKVADEKLVLESTWFADEIFDHLEEDNTAPALAERIASHGFSTKSFVVIKEEVFRMEDLEAGDEGILREDLNITDKITHLHTSGFQTGLLIWDLAIEDEKHKDLTIKDTAQWTKGDIDFSNPAAVDFFKSKLTTFKAAQKVDLYVFSAQGAAIKSITQMSDPGVQKYPSQLATKYIEAANQIGGPIVVEQGFKTQHVPVWVRLSDYRFTPYSDTLKHLVSNVLAVSIAGYSYIQPHSAGGFVFIQPTEEQYIRWVQAIALMPSMSFIQTPWWFSESAVNITKKMIDLHNQHAPTIILLGQKRIETGSPIIRPMWYHAPDDPKAYGIGDQFMVGEDLVVAPVLAEGIRERQVYLPTGTWLDQHGKSFDGPAEFKVAAPLDELAYFKRKV